MSLFDDESGPSESPVCIVRGKVGMPSTNFNVLDPKTEITYDNIGALFSEVLAD